MWDTRKFEKASKWLSIRVGKKDEENISIEVIYIAALNKVLFCTLETFVNQLCLHPTLTLPMLLSPFLKHPLPFPLSTQQWRNPTLKNLLFLNLKMVTPQKLGPWEVPKVMPMNKLQEKRHQGLRFGDGISMSSALTSFKQFSSLCFFLS